MLPPKSHLQTTTMCKYFGKPFSFFQTKWNTPTNRFERTSLTNVKHICWNSIGTSSLTPKVFADAECHLRRTIISDFSLPCSHEEHQSRRTVCVSEKFLFCSVFYILLSVFLKYNYFFRIFLSKMFGFLRNLDDIKFRMVFEKNYKSVLPSTS